MQQEWSQLQSDIISSCSSRESSGWHSIMCPMCGGGTGKRITGGFLLTDDAIVYSCFRGKCDAATGMELGNFVPNKFKDLMERIGIPVGMKIRTAKRRVKTIEDDLDSTIYKKHHYKSIDIPSYWIPIDTISKPHLTDPMIDRCCRLDDVYYIDNGEYEGLLGLRHKWYNRTVGMTVFGNYPFQIEGSDHMMYTMNGKVGDTVLLVEGQIDAMSMPNAVSCHGYSISPEQAYLLKDKKVICIPEQSNKFIDQFEDYGWSMCIPPWDSDDLNAAVVKYGILVVAQMIRDSVVDNPLKARVEYKLWSNKHKRKSNGY